MVRYLYSPILRDLRRKMVILTGPRQIGKTWLAKELMSEFKIPQYLNYDHLEDARIIQQYAWPLNCDMLVLDEIHKMKGWKTFIKGVFDTRLKDQAIMITGSSRLDTFRQSGDSLAGRYFHFRLNPISVREAASMMKPEETLTVLNRLGGFPEPLLSGSEEDAARWRRQYYTDLVREDILEFGRVQEIRTLRLLLELLRERVGSPLSYTSLAGDLKVAPNTVCKYVEILENLCIVFTIRPFHRNIARALLRKPKVYFYDSGHVKGGDGIRLENTCAVCLLKHVQYLQDTTGEDIDLHYLKTRDGKEIDFGISQQGQLVQLIEIKLSDSIPSPHLRYFMERMTGVTGLQLVQHLRREQNVSGLSIVAAGNWLAQLAA